MWTEAMMQSIGKMLNPRSIAVVGATPRLQYGGRFLASVLRAKDRVNIYPINPKYELIMNTRAYPSVVDLPEAPDLVGIMVPYGQVLDVLKASHQRGAGSAIIISAGFAERGTEEGRELQKELGVFAASSGLRIAGPNCLGMANIKDDIWPTGAVENTAGGLTGHIGLICQSGATAFGPFLARAMDNGIGFSHIISTGNEADLDFADFARYLLDEPSTRVIAGFVEGFKDAAKLLAVAELAAERGKPIVLIKIGRSESGVRAAQSHTAALTGADALYEAVFKQYGVIRVQDYDELLQIVQLFAHSRPPTRTGVAMVSHSGGISSLTADLLGQEGLELPLLSSHAEQGINQILKGFGWAANPADITGFADSESFPEIMDLMINEPDVGTLVIASGGAGKQPEQIAELRNRTEKNIAYLWTGSRGNSEGLARLKSANLPIFYAPEKIAHGVKTLLDYHDCRNKRLHAQHSAAPAPTPEQVAARTVLIARGAGSLSETESKLIVAAWGVPITREFSASTADAAVAAAKRIGGAVALKIDSPDILHKTEANAVRLGLQHEDDIRAAYRSIIANATAYAPDASIAGVLVQEMITGGVEVIVGVSYDPQLGPMLLFGTGGVMVEVYNDVALRRCPIERWEAFDMIGEVKGAKLLRGFRGAPAADIEALADTLVKVSHLAVHLEGQVAEIDINPLVVLPAGQGVRAVDALLVMRQAP